LAVRTWLWPVILVIVCAALFAGTLGNEVVSDDRVILLEDPRVRWGQFLRLLTGNYWYKQGADLLYRPLVMVSYAANWAVSGEFWTFRVVNIALHAGVCIALYRFMLAVFGSGWAAGAGSLLFAVHPVHTETLNLIVGRADLAVALCMLTAALFSWRDAGNGACSRPRQVGEDASARAGGGRWRPALAAGLFGVAILCKENAVTLIGLVAALDAYRWWRPELRPARDGRRRWWLGRLLRWYLPMLAVLGLYLAARWAVLGRLSRDPGEINVVDNPIAHPEYGLGPADSAWLARWATPLVTFAKAVDLTIWPVRLCHDYSLAAIETVKRLGDPRLAGAMLRVAFVLVAALACFRWLPGGVLAIATWLVTYSIVSNVPIVIGTIFAERLLYVPSIGFCMLAGLLLAAAVARWRTWQRPRADWPWRRRVLGDPGGLVAAVWLVVFVVGVAWFGWLTVRRNRLWRTSGALVEHDFAIQPRSCRLLGAMARIRAGRGDPDGALELCKRALKIAPRFSRTWWTAAYAYRQKGINDEAFNCVRNALLLGAGGNPAAVGLAAELYVERGDYATAIRLLEKLLQYQPTSWEAQNNLASYLIEAKPPELRDPERALEHARMARKLNPHGAAPLETLVAVLVALGRREEALRTLTQALPDIRPDDPFRPLLEKHLRSLRGQPASPTTAAASRPRP